MSKQNIEIEHQPVSAKPLQVDARPGEPPEKMISRFVKKVRADGILDEYRAKQSYEKPSVRRRRKRAAAASVRRKAESEKEKS